MKLFHKIQLKKKNEYIVLLCQLRALKDACRKSTIKSKKKKYLTLLFVENYFVGQKSDIDVLSNYGK